MIFEPLLASLQASVLVDAVDGVQVDARLVAHAVAALSIVHEVRIAAARRHSARLDPRIVELALEVGVLVPVVGHRHAAALEPVALYPIDEILEVGVLAIIRDHELQVLLDLVLHLVLVHEYEYAEGELGEEDEAEREAEDEQQRGVLAQGAHAAAEADDEDERADDEEDEGRVEYDADAERAEARERLLLDPGVDADQEEQYADEPEEHVEGEEQVLDERTDVAGLLGRPTIAECARYHGGACCRRRRRRRCGRRRRSRRRRVRRLGHI